MCRDVRLAHALLPVAVDTAGPGSGAGHERTRLRKMSASVRDAVGSWALIRIGAARRARQGHHVGSVKRVACAVGEVRLPSGRFTCICSVSPAGQPAGEGSLTGRRSSRPRLVTFPHIFRTGLV